MGTGGIFIFDCIHCNGPHEEAGRVPFRQVGHAELEQILERVLIQLAHERQGESTCSPSNSTMERKAEAVAPYRLDQCHKSPARLPLSASLQRLQQTLGQVVAQLREGMPTQERLAHIQKLSEREFDVLLGLLQGKSCKQIAATLRIGLPSVTKHRTHLYQKLQIQSLAELLAFLWSCGEPKGCPQPDGPAIN